MQILRRSATAAVLVALVVPADVIAQQAGGRDTARDRRTKAAIKVEPWLSLEGEYDSNVFLLRQSRRRALENPSAGDISSGRFDGMESAADVILQARAGVGLELDGLGGRALALSPALRYDHYMRNDARSHLTASVALSQALPRGMRTRLEASYTPSYFPKTYLVDAIDADGNRMISPEERRYERAEYSAMDVELAHRLRLRKSTKRSPLGVELDVAAGYYARSFDAPFANRDVSGPTLRAELGLAPGRRADFTLGYDLEILSGDAAQEVLILNEADAGRDLNGNGSANDLNVRTVQLVDRSRREHELTAGARFDVARRTDLRIRYGLRFRAYSSDQPLDPGHRDRRDTRHDLRGELSTRIARGVRLATGARVARQTTNRLVDPEQTDEGDDYSRIRAFAGVRVEF